MVYGILLMINFAHSEIFMVGAYFGFWALTLLPMFLHDMPPIYFTLVFAIAMIGAGLLAVTVERIAYRPLRHVSRLAPLISAIGVSIFLQNFVQVVVSAQSTPYPETLPIKQFQFLGVQVNTLQIFIFVLAISAMVILQLFIKKSRWGKAMRATAQNHTVSELMGINVSAIISITFLIGGALGGLAGVLNGMYYGSIKFNMGFFPGLKAFTAAVLGGIGNVAGAMVGGFALGIIEELSIGFVSSAYKDVILFMVLILVLIFRPTGIFGEAVTEKI
jgi:branched-chain amino acid transport system permease protein